MSKDYYQYDGNGWQIEQLNKDSVNGTWKTDYRISFAYNTNGKELERIQQKWINNAWRNFSKRVFTYNSYENFLTDNSYAWDTISSVWIPNGYQRTYTYDGNNNKTMQLQVNTTNGVVVDSLRSTFTHDLNGNELTELREGWQATNQIWFNMQQWYHVYNVNNQRDSTYNAIWNSLTSTFDTNYLTTYTYNSFGDILDYFNHQKSGNNWVNTTRQTNGYDANGNQITVNTYMWNGSIWVQNSQTVYGFNANNQQTSYLSQQFNSTLGVYINSYQATLLYDANDMLEFYIYEGWNTANSNWDLYSKQRHFNSCNGSLNINEKTSLIIKCYPNPAKTQIVIEVNELVSAAITSSNGSILSMLELNGETTIDVSNYAPGIYFIITSEGQTVKFIKE